MIDIIMDDDPEDAQPGQEDPEEMPDGADVVEEDTPDMPDVIDETLPKDLFTEDLVGNIRQLSQISKRHVESANPITDSPNVIQAAISGELEQKLTSEDQVAMAEFNLLLAKYGKTPTTSVEGIIELRRTLVEAYKDNQLVPKATRLELANLNRELKALEATYNEYIEKTKSQAESAAIESKKSGVLATQELEEATRELEASRVKSELVVQGAEVEVIETSVINKKRVGVAQNTERVLDKTLDNDRLAKIIDAHKESGRIITRKLVRPVLRVVVTVTVIGVIFSFFVEMSGMEMYPIIRPFNEIRHFIFDPIWGTIQNVQEETSQ